MAIRVTQCLALALAGTGCTTPQTWPGPAADATYLRCADHVMPRLRGDGPTFHVDGGHPDASDAHDGRSADTPWKTLAHATATLAAGETAQVTAGSYGETDLMFATSGTLDQPIALVAGPGGAVVVDGTGLDSALGGLAIDQDHIVVEGLTFQGHAHGIGTYHPDPTRLIRGVVLRDLVVRDNAYDGMHLSNARDFAVVNVEATGNRGDGIAILGSGDSTYASHGIVSGVFIHDNLADASHGLSINQAHSIAVCDSEARDNGSHGFDVSDWPKYGAISHQILFEGNRSSGHRDQAGFSVNSDSHGVVFLRNVATDNEEGFYGYEGCAGTQWLHNVAVRNKNAFRVVDAPGRRVDTASTSLVFQNNISFDNHWAGTEFAKPALEIQSGAYTVFIAHNALVPHELASTSVRIDGVDHGVDDLEALGDGNLGLPPGFVDAEAGDFTLAADSPMLDAGVEVSVDGVLEPWSGTAPDLGAFER